MKPQDILFIIVIGVMLFFRARPSAFVVLGLLCLIISIPLFTFWVFFTAERLVYFAAGFILTGALITLFKKTK